MDPNYTLIKEDFQYLQVKMLYTYFDVCNYKGSSLKSKTFLQNTDDR